MPPLPVDRSPFLIRLRDVVVVELLLLGAAILLGVWLGDVKHQFSERGLITWLSVAHLLAAAVVSWKMFRTYDVRFRLGDWRQPHYLLPLNTAGFTLLAIDEKFKGHENIDRGIHALFGFEETPSTDHIDDLLVGVYGLVALLVLFYYRHELRRFVVVWPFLVAGMLFLFAMVTCDVVSHHNDRVLMTMLDVHLTLGMAEEACKLLSEGMLLAGFANCLLLSRSGRWAQNESRLS